MILYNIKITSNEHARREVLQRIGQETEHVRQATRSVTQSKVEFYYHSAQLVLVSFFITVTDSLIFQMILTSDIQKLRSISVNNFFLKS